MEILAKKTRFRAYQLGIPGSLFSYFDGTEFTLIEAKIGELSASSLVNELHQCGKKEIDNLHITSWDNDHCDAESLKIIFDKLKPKSVVYPGYQPSSESGQKCLRVIQSEQTISILGRDNYYTRDNSIGIDAATPDLINNLPPGRSFDYGFVMFSPRKLYEKSNDNSVVMLYRSGCFTVASLGDVENSEIADMLMDDRIFNTETDVLILAHHGADNGFTTNEFIKRINPSVVICSSNYDSQFEHPRPEIRRILSDNFVPIYTTKTGDVIIESIEDNKTNYRVINLKANSSEVSSARSFMTKRYKHSISPMLRELLGYK